MDDRFITPCELPNERQREILTIIIEEAAEVQQRATKALRFGLDEKQPGQNFDNAQRLAQEIGDLDAVIGLACKEGLVRGTDILSAERAKERKLLRYMQTEPPQTSGHKQQGEHQ